MDCVCDESPTHFLVREGPAWRSVPKDSDEGKQLALDLEAQAETRKNLLRKVALANLRAEVKRRQKQLNKAQRRLEAMEATP